jgi:hypothetical protein
MLTNNGDVTLAVDWDSADGEDQPQKTCTLSLPEPVSIPPGRSVRCIFGATAHVVGPLSATLVIKTKEKVYSVPVFGKS